MAQELADTLGLGQVHFIPTASPPHRPQPQTAAAHRLTMVRLAIEGNPLFRCDDREMRRHAEEQLPSYTVDTLLSLKHELEEDTALCLLLGGDAFLGLPTWHRWEELLNHCHVVVAHRPHAELRPTNFPPSLQALWSKSGTSDVKDLRENRSGCLMLQPITALDISATRIRQDLKLRQNPRYLLPDSVIEYISSQKLYL